MNSTASPIKGTFTGHYSSTLHGFVYEYECEACGDRFLETSPEVSRPCLCQGCYSGSNLLKHERYRRRKKLQEG